MESKEEKKEGGLPPVEKSEKQEGTYSSHMGFQSLLSKEHN